MEKNKLIREIEDLVVFLTTKANDAQKREEVDIKKGYRKSAFYWGERRSEYKDIANRVIAILKKMKR